MAHRIEADRLMDETLQQGGRVRLSVLLAALVPVVELRDLVSKFGLSPKGFRIARAPAHVLADLVADAENVGLLGDACRLLAAHMGAAEPPPTPASKPERDPVLELRERELSQARAETEKVRRSAKRDRDRADELAREILDAKGQLARLRAELDAARRELDDGPPVSSADRSSVRIHDLERELEQLAASEQEGRRRLAEQAARNRELETYVAELEERVPRRRTKRVQPPLPEDSTPCRIPRFAATFYAALEDRDRKAIDRVMQAVFVLCTFGPSYPGLEAKQIEGQDLWSIRAGLKLRVYYVTRADGTIELLDVVDREAQNTSLRRWKVRRSNEE